MISWNDIAMQQEHYQDLLREAKQNRLIQEARAGRPSRARLMEQVLASLRPGPAALPTRPQERAATRARPDRALRGPSQA
jgi:hypothetical protein